MYKLAYQFRKGRRVIKFTVNGKTVLFKPDFNIDTAQFVTADNDSTLPLKHMPELYVKVESLISIVRLIHKRAQYVNGIRVGDRLCIDADYTILSVNISSNTRTYNCTFVECVSVNLVMDFSLQAFSYISQQFMRVHLYYVDATIETDQANAYLYSIHGDNMLIIADSYERANQLILSTELIHDAIVDPTKIMYTKPKDYAQFNLIDIASVVCDSRILNVHGIIKRYKFNGYGISFDALMEKLK